MATTKKKSTPRKPGTAKTKSRRTAKKAKPAGPREEAIANDALELVDKAAGLLRKAIRGGAETSRTARLQAKRQAHTLITRASSTLEQVLSEGTSTLHKVISKI
jgi:hypothetical protein